MPARGRTTASRPSVQPIVGGSRQALACGIFESADLMHVRTGARMLNAKRHFFAQFHRVERLTPSLDFSKPANKDRRDEQSRSACHGKWIRDTGRRVSAHVIGPEENRTRTIDDLSIDVRAQVSLAGQAGRPRRRMASNRSRSLERGPSISLALSASVTPTP